MKDHERFKNISNGVQSIVLSVAVLVGGFWSLFVFGTLRSIEKARTELDVLQKDVKGTPSLVLSLDVSQTAGTEIGSTGLIVLVTVQNKGSKHILLDLTQNSLRVSRVGVQKDGSLYPIEIQMPKAYRSIGDSVYLVASTQTIQVGATKVLPYYFEVGTAGVYRIDFRSPVAENLRADVERDYKDQLENIVKKLESTGNLVEGPPHWSASTFIDVKSDSATR